MSKVSAWVATLVAVCAAALVAFVGSQNGTGIGNVPIFSLVVIATLVIQWIAFVPSWLGRTEKFFDLMGSCGYLVAVWAALLCSGLLNARSLVIVFCITLWALRLGVYLTIRVVRTGSDQRFDEIKQSFPLLFMTWTLQALWIIVTSSAALVALTSSNSSPPVDPWLLGGAILWIAGISLEVIADAQKSKFRSDPLNKHKFISTGLWALSQHPNYFGEILLWVGIAAMSFPTLHGWQFVTLASPVFVWLLLTRISGARMLDDRAKKLWGDDPEYQQYVLGTSKLILWPPSKR